MITEFIISVFLSPINWLVSTVSFAFPVITLPVDVLVGFETLISYVYWILPLGALLPVLVARVGLNIVNLGWKTLLRLKSFIPTLGD